MWYPDFNIYVSSSEKCTLPNTNTCINVRMQLNLNTLNALSKSKEPSATSKEETDSHPPDYYITMTISRDEVASGDDLAFTCTSEQKKVLLYVTTY